MNTSPVSSLGEQQVKIKNTLTGPQPVDTHPEVQDNTLQLESPEMEDNRLILQMYRTKMLKKIQNQQK